MKKIVGFLKNCLNIYFLFCITILRNYTNFTFGENLKFYEMFAKIIFAKLSGVAAAIVRDEKRQNEGPGQEQFVSLYYKLSSPSLSLSLFLCR